MKFQRTDAAAPVGGELLPDGEHDVEIVAVKEWSSREGDREATILTLQPLAPQYAAVEKWLDPSNERDQPLVTQLADVLGLEGDEIDISEETCKGRRVRIAAKTGTRKKDGASVVYVNGFLEPATPSKPAYEQNREREAKAIAKRTAHQKAKAAAAQAGDDDGIPF